MRKLEKHWDKDNDNENNNNEDNNNNRDKDNRVNDKENNKAVEETCSGCQGLGSDGFWDIIDNKDNDS